MPLAARRCIDTVSRYRRPICEQCQTLRAAGGDPLGDPWSSLDAESYTIDIKKTGRTADVHPAAVFAHDRVDPKVLQEALLRLGQYVADQGITGDGPYRAARELLQRKAPSLGGEPIRKLPGRPPWMLPSVSRERVISACYRYRGRPAPAKPILRRA